MQIKPPRIRELTYSKNRKEYKSHRVDWTDAAGKRHQRQFTDRNEASLFSSEKYTELLNQGASHRNISTVLPAEVVREAEACVTRLGNRYSLTQAVDFFLEHFHEPEFKISVSEASVQFRGALEGQVRDRSLVQLKSTLGQFEQFTETCQLHEITPKTVEHFLRSLRAKDGVRAASRKTWNNYRADLHLFFEWCRDEQRRWLGSNPAAPTKRFKIDRKHVHVLNQETARALMNFAREFKGGKMARYFALALFAGIRTDGDGELGKLAESPGQVDLENKVIRITEAISKTHEPRQVKIRPNLYKWLTRYAGDILPVNSDRDIKSVRKKFGLNKPTNRDVLRHTFISMHIGAFKSFADAAIESGNSESIIRKHYLNTSTLRQAKAFWQIVP
jgi:integrase